MARTFEDLKAEIKVEQAKEYQKAYYQENKEHMKAYYQKNKEKLKEHQKAYYQENKEHKNKSKFKLLPHISLLS